MQITKWITFEWCTHIVGIICVLTGGKLCQAIQFVVRIFRFISKCLHIIELWAIALITYIRFSFDSIFLLFHSHTLRFSLFRLFLAAFFTNFGSFHVGDLVRELQCHKLNWFKWPIHCYFRFMPRTFSLLLHRRPSFRHFALSLPLFSPLSVSIVLYVNKNFVKSIDFPNKHTAVYDIHFPLWPHFQCNWIFRFLVIG